MAAFGVETDDNLDVKDFMEKSANRLNSNNFIKNPFMGTIRQIGQKDNKLSFVIVMRPLYFEFYYMGLLWIASTLFFTGIVWTMWLLPGIILYSLGIFWSAGFYYLLLRVGLRKAGYRGQIRRISKEDIIDLMLKPNIPLC